MGSSSSPQNSNKYSHCRHGVICEDVFIKVRVEAGHGRGVGHTSLRIRRRKVCSQLADNGIRSPNEFRAKSIQSEPSRLGRSTGVVVQKHKGDVVPILR